MSTVTNKKDKSKSDKEKKRNNKTTRILVGIATNMFKHGFLVFRQLLDMFIDFVFSYLWEDSKQVLPDLDKRHNILKESAVSLAAKIRNKELKSEELVQCCIERIKIVNPILNAVTDERFEDALKDAREVDAKLQGGLSAEDFEKKPFLGVPFTCKESHAVSGMLHTLGLAARRYTRASEDAECVRLLREAGAIPLAVTNVPEVNKWQETRNMIFGQTNNPYHTGRSPGGSSGGEAALCAALATPISLCSDIGGSTRMPAFYCGLFGHNPTGECTSLKGSLLRPGTDPTIASIGFISRAAEDLAPLMRIVAAGDAHKLHLDRDFDIKDIKWYYTETCKDLRVSPICKDLRDVMTKVLNNVSCLSSKSGVMPAPYSHRALRHMYALWRYWMSREAQDFALVLANNKRPAAATVELPRKLIGKSEYTLAAVLKLVDEQILPAVDADWAETLTQEITQDLTSLLGENGVLLFPSAPFPAPYHYSAYLRPFNFAYWAFINVLKFPATQIPLGLNSEGLPLGIQVVSGPGNDALCLGVARYLEEQFGGYVPPCNVVQ